MAVEEVDELTLITLFSHFGQCLLDEELCEQAYELRTRLIALLKASEVPERHGSEGLSHVMVDVIASYLCPTVGARCQGLYLDISLRSNHQGLS
jgi:hypothetical protein